VLEVMDLNTARGRAHVLRGVGIAVHESEIVCLVGRNGAGKTTTMDSIMGILPVMSGHVIFRGKDITRLPPHRRAKLGMGYAPEDTGVFPELTVDQNLDLGAWLADGGERRRADSTERLEKIYELFPELRPLGARRGLHLSGGEKKMLAIGRAMALRPSVLLLDEAFEGLAPVVVARFADAVMKIKQMGISLLIAESNAVTAARVAERLYVIDRGEIIFEGDPKTVFDDAEVMKTIRG
jgi:branched-chain amino acid transport system ATP-binding protein